MEYKVKLSAAEIIWSRSKHGQTISGKITDVKITCKSGEEIEVTFFNNDIEEAEDIKSTGHQNK